MQSGPSCEGTSLELRQGNFEPRKASLSSVALCDCGGVIAAHCAQLVRYLPRALARACALTPLRRPPAHPPAPQELYLFYFVTRYPARTLVFTNTIASGKRLLSFFALLGVHAYGPCTG